MPHSVVDIGCGSGSWLLASKDLGVDIIHGVDINEVDEQTLFVPRDDIEIFDFSKLSSQNAPVTHESYDLAISLEVAEHLDAQNAVPFIKYLTSFSDVVLFSAAHPFQKGVHHVNCQPASYWADLFKKEGYTCVDLLRRKLMFEPQLSECFWYGQNSFLFVRDTQKELLEELNEYVVDIPVSYYHQAVVSDMIIQLTRIEKSLWYRIQRKFQLPKLPKGENSILFRAKRKIKKILHLYKEH